MNLEANPIIAAVRSDEGFDRALKSPCNVVFMLHASILTIQQNIESAKRAGKSVFVHIDVAEGIGKDSAGLKFLASLGVDGVISTRSSMIRMAKECKLVTVQRVFIVDSHSVDTAMEFISSCRPDMIEIMPGVVPRAIEVFVKKTSTPLIAGGLIEDKRDIFNALEAGVLGISTAKETLWYE